MLFAILFLGSIILGWIFFKNDWYTNALLSLYNSFAFIVIGFSEAKIADIREKKERMTQRMFRKKGDWNDDWNSENDSTPENVYVPSDEVKGMFAIFFPTILFGFLLIINCATIWIFNKNIFKIIFGERFGL
jgi:hypothetical protein